MPMVKFTPSPEQREVVAALSASKMPLEKIAASIINPRTQRAISVKTLGRMFKDQLDEGVGVIVEAIRGLRAALAEKQPWAIKYTLDHVAEFKAKERDVSTPEAVKQQLLQINVTGIPAPPHDDEPVPSSIIDAKPIPTLPRVDAYPLGGELPVAQERPPEQPRTELDYEGALIPWWRKPIDGHSVKKRS